MGLNIWRWLLASQNTGKVTNGHDKSQISDVLGRPDNPGNDNWNTAILNVHSQLNLILFKGDSLTIVSHSHSAWVHFREHTHTHTRKLCVAFYSALLFSPERLWSRSWWSCSVSWVCGLHSSSAQHRHDGEQTGCLGSGVCRFGWSRYCWCNSQFCRLLVCSNRVQNSE